MTSWGELVESGLLVAERSSSAEIWKLMTIAERELKDAEARGLSAAGRFGHAYSAARSLATTVIRAEGYRTRGGEGAHHVTFRALGIADSAFRSQATYFDRCRRKRNDMLYTGDGHVTQAEAEELLAHAHAFLPSVSRWLRGRHADLVVGA
jgi:hypothetical protein